MDTFHTRNEPGRKSRRRSTILGAIALVAVAALLLVFLTGNQGRLFPFLSPDRQIGQEVSVPKDSLPNNLMAEVSKEPPSIPDVVNGPVWIKRLTPVIDLTPSGQLPAPVPFTFSLSESLTDDENLLVRVNHSQPFDPNAWETVPAQLSSDRSEATVTLDHLSLAEFCKVNRETVKKVVDDFINEAFSGAFSEAKEAKCDGKDKALAGGYSYRAEPDEKFMPWCYGYDARTNDRFVKITNPRRYPIEITDDSNMAVVDEGDVPVSMVQARRLNHTVIMPRESMTFQADQMEPGKTKFVSTYASGWGTALTAVDGVAKAFLLLTAGMLGKATEGSLAAMKSGRMVNLDDIGLKGVKFADFMKTILTTQKCQIAMGADNPNLPKVLNECFDIATLMKAAGVVGFSPLAMAIAGVIAGFIAVSSVVFALIDFPRVLFNYIGDKQNGRDKFKVTASRAKLSIPANFVGEWAQYNGGQTHALTINRNGTGSVAIATVMGEGVVDPLYPDGVFFKANFKLVPTDGGLLATYTRLDYPEDTMSYDPGLLKVGDTAKFAIGDYGVLHIELLGRASHLNGVSREGGYPGLAAYCTTKSGSMIGCSAG